MSSAEPCKFCGCVQTNLIDGFYYCAECGTQDTNIQETLVEFTTLGDGMLALGSRKTCRTHLPKVPEIQMTEDWYKWHSLNFLLRGLADEVIACGAQPSFKTKLLWVWTLYMDKFQNKADFGLAANEEPAEDVENMGYPKADSDDDVDSDDENSNKIKHLPAHFLSNKRDIKIIRMPLIISMIYVALNLDKSHIQLAQLLELMKLCKISIIGWSKHVPEELKPKKLKVTLFFNYNCFVFSYDLVRCLSLSLFRDLNLGNPVVPDLRLIADNYLKELCLPNDLKPLVFSLINARSFDYLDVNVLYPEYKRMPSYELFVMGHIVMALKVCFGLDSKYEYKLSDAVHKINALEKYPKSYNINVNPEPTDRLFNFVEWCDHLKFRKTVISTHCFHLGSSNYYDIDDYIAMEQLPEKPDHKKNLRDEIAYDILKKIPDPEINVIPQSEFKTTLTPFTTYTQVILDHTQDPKVKMLLAEDFTQYSLKYVTEDMFLVDPDSSKPENILHGICRNDVDDTYLKFDIQPTTYTIGSTQVYVKDCDNHNWLKTLRPHVEHVINEDTSDIDESNEKENDCNTDSTLIDVVRDSEKQKSINNISINFNQSNLIYDEYNTSVEQDEKSFISVHVNESENKEFKSEDDKQINKILEEEDNINIFDDDFIDLVVKKEEEDPAPQTNNDDIDIDNIDITQNDLMYDTSRNYNHGDNDSDASSEDSLHMTPDTLNRDEAIKELVIHACRKYKVSIPGKFMHRTRKTVNNRPIDNKILKQKRFRKAGEVKQIVDGFLAAYQARVENDIFHQMSSMVQSAVTNFNKTINEPQTQAEEEPALDEASDNIDADIEQNDGDNQPLNNTLQTLDDDGIQDEEYKLFGESSEGETYAEELLPKKNPDFDEETHDVRQLYLKQPKDPGVADMELNPKLQKIVKKRIEAEEADPKIVDKLKDDKESSDSEDDIPLNLHREQSKLRAQLSKQESLLRSGKLPRLIQNDDIRSYNYWTKSITKLCKTKIDCFNSILDTVFPKSFSFVLKQCSEVVGYQPWFLYVSLQNIEEFLSYNNIYFNKAKKRRVQENLRKSIMINSKRCREV